VRPLQPFTSLAALLRHVRATLEQAGIADAALDARLIVEHFADASRADTVLDPGRQIDENRTAAVIAALDRRLAGEPVHRVIGARDFYGLRLKLSPGTLEPRPDTEALVDLALSRLGLLCDSHAEASVLDLGTGTGAIALALLDQEPRATATGTDISSDALATAAANADINGLESRFRTLRSDWYGGVAGRFHMIVSNPPYIASTRIAALQREVRDHDPRGALDGGDDGLDAYRAIAQGAFDHLQPDGVVAVEIGHDQADAVPAIFAAHGFRLAESRRDLAGTVRALLFESLAA
jgi:release factor glutamine methyltransferase